MCTYLDLSFSRSINIDILFFRALFPRYPFLLPNLAVALVALVSLPFVLFVLPETLRVEREGVGGGKGTADEDRRYGEADASVR